MILGSSSNVIFKFSYEIGVILNHSFRSLRPDSLPVSCIDCMLIANQIGQLSSNLHIMNGYSITADKLSIGQSSSKLVKPSVDSELDTFIELLSPIISSAEDMGGDVLEGENIRSSIGME